MIAIPDRCYPLSWPAGRARARGRYASAFVKSEANPEEVYSEIRRISGVKTIILSSNMPLRSDGTPAARSPNSPGGDPGVVAYWTRNEWRAGKSQLVPYCIPVDRWDRISCNLHALALSIAAMRGMERWGAVSLEQAFAGFAALPAGSSEHATPAARPWRDVLGGVWPLELDREGTLAIAKARYRVAIGAVHPDRGGSTELAASLNAAMAAAEVELA